MDYSDLDSLQQLRSATETFCAATKDDAARKWAGEVLTFCENLTGGSSLAYKFTLTDFPITVRAELPGVDNAESREQLENSNRFLVTTDVELETVPEAEAERIPGVDLLCEVIRARLGGLPQCGLVLPRKAMRRMTFRGSEVLERTRKALELERNGFPSAPSPYILT